MMVKNKNYFYILLISSIVLIGFVLRIINISEYSFWVDEYVHYERAFNFINKGASLFTKDNNGILYTLFLVPLFELFSPTVFLTRLPSVFFGTGSIILVFILGKRLYNSYVGSIAAFLNVFSLYLIYWSKIARFYAIFEFFFLLLLIVLLEFFEPKKNITGVKVFKKLNINIKTALWVILVGFLSILTNQLLFFSFFGIIFYLGVLGIINFKNKTEKNRVKYVYLGLSSLVLIVLVFMPFSEPAVRGFLGLFVYGEGNSLNVIDWILPNWDRVNELTKTQPFSTFNIYWGVLSYDIKLPLLIFGLVGLIIGLFKRFKPTLFIASFLIIPFLLMSFLFREPSLPRYLIYLVPLVHLLIGIAFFEIIKVLKSNVPLFQKGFFSKALPVLLPLVIILTQIRYSEITSLIEAEVKIGNIVNRKLSSWSFTNYADPAKYIKRYLKDDDIIFSTHPSSSKFYLGREDIVHFRQRFYNTVTYQYELFPYDTINKISGKSLKNIQKVYDNYDRGWLFADYYFNNVMTDPKVKFWVFRHMNYHPNATPDGSASVFSWDKSVPVPQYQAIVEDIGKSHIKQSSTAYQFVVNKINDSNYTLNVIAENINTNNEAFILINNKKYFSLPKNNKKNTAELIEITVSSKHLINGQNTVEFVYNSKIKRDKVKGFIIYNFYLKYP